MYVVSKKLKKKHNITDERAALYAAVNIWIKALNGRQFIGMCDMSTIGRRLRLALLVPLCMSVSCFLTSPNEKLEVLKFKKYFAYDFAPSWFSLNLSFFRKRRNMEFS